MSPTRLPDHALCPTVTRINGSPAPHPTVGLGFAKGQNSSGLGRKGVPQRWVAAGAPALCPPHSLPTFEDHQDPG